MKIALGKFGVYLETGKLEKNCVICGGEKIHHEIKRHVYNTEYSIGASLNLVCTCSICKEDIYVGSIGIYWDKEKIHRF